MTQNDNQNEIGNRSGSRRKWSLLGLAGLFIAIGMAYAVYYFAIAQFYTGTDDAYVHGNSVQLEPRHSGTVVSIAADNTDLVHAGQTVVRLDPTDARNALKHAKAQLAEAIRSARQLFAQVDEQKSIIAQRKASLAQAKSDYKRDQHLVKQNGMSRQAFERARSSFHQKRAALAAAQHKLAELKAQTDGTSVRNHPQVKAAIAELRHDYLVLQRTHIRAPVTGYVAQRKVQVGQRVDPDKPMLSIVPIHQIWVQANFKETALDSMRIGQRATVIADFYGDDVTYHGHVAGISPGTGAAFELLPPQNATGNWIKIVRRVPVRIVLDDNQDKLSKYPLRLGLSMQVTVDQHDTSGPRLSQNTPDKPRYSTQIYKQRLAGANRLVQHILDANDGTTRQAALSSKSSSENSKEHS